MFQEKILLMVFRYQYIRDVAGNHQKGLTEKDEFDLRRDFVKKQGASDHAISTLDEILKNMK